MLIAKFFATLFLVTLELLPFATASLTQNAALDSCANSNACKAAQADFLDCSQHSLSNVTKPVMHHDIPGCLCPYGAGRVNPWHPDWSDNLEGCITCVENAMPKDGTTDGFPSMSQGMKDIIGSHGNSKGLCAKLHGPYNLAQLYADFENLAAKHNFPMALPQATFKPAKVVRKREVTSTFTSTRFETSIVTVMVSCSAPVCSALTSSSSSATSASLTQSSPTTSEYMTTMTSPLPLPSRCNHDNCLREMIRDDPAITAFCATYTTSKRTDCSGLPLLVYHCGNDPSRLSSACSCLKTLPLKSSTTCTESAETSKETTSMVPSTSCTESSSKPGHTSGHASSTSCTDSSTFSIVIIPSSIPSVAPSTTPQVFSTTPVPQQNTMTSQTSSIVSSTFTAQSSMSSEPPSGVSNTSCTTITGTTTRIATIITLPVVPVSATESVSKLTSFIVSEPNLPTTSTDSILPVTTSNDVISQPTGSPESAPSPNSAFPISPQMKACEFSVTGCKQAGMLFQQCLLDNKQDLDVWDCLCTKTTQSWNTTSIDCATCIAKALPPNNPAQLYSTEILVPQLMKAMSAYCNLDVKHREGSTKGLVKAGRVLTAAFQSPLLWFNMTEIEKPVAWPVVMGSVEVIMGESRGMGFRK